MDRGADWEAIASRLGLEIIARSSYMNRPTQMVGVVDDCFTAVLLHEPSRFGPETTREFDNPTTSIEVSWQYVLEGMTLPEGLRIKVRRSRPSGSGRLQTRLGWCIFEGPDERVVMAKAKDRDALELWMTHQRIAALVGPKWDWRLSGIEARAKRPGWASDREIIDTIHSLTSLPRHLA
jgi:hypothetical protein